MRWMGALGVLTVTAAMGAGSAIAQDGRVVVFQNSGFSGPSAPFTRANPDLGRAITVRSARIESGSWELCERTRFRTPCVTLTQSEPSLARPQGWRGSMLSIRPVAPPEPPASDRRRPAAPSLPTPTPPEPSKPPEQ